MMIQARCYARNDIVMRYAGAVLRRYARAAGAAAMRAPAPGLLRLTIRARMRIMRRVREARAYARDVDDRRYAQRV